MEEVFKKEFLNELDVFLKICEKFMQEELEYIQIVKSFEASRQQWCHVELELCQTQEQLLRANMENSALEVKLKHARNQVDVEMKKRHKAEAECERLERQMQLIHDILIHDGHLSFHLSEEQKSVLASLSGRCFSSLGLTPNSRLAVIDKSCASVLSHSDISYDRTDDDLDFDSSVVKPLKARNREKRRSSLMPAAGPPVPPKRSRPSAQQGDLPATTGTAEVAGSKSVENPPQTIPEEGDGVQMVTVIKAVPCEQSSRSRVVSSCTEQTTIWGGNEDFKNTPCDTPIEPEPDPKFNYAFKTLRGSGAQQHLFVSKTVIRPETCVPCGKRIQFGKLAVKCRDCRLMAHPKCKDRCLQLCVPTVSAASTCAGKGVLADFASPTSPMIPSLIVHCVNEIERRGLTETGIYRIPGCERQVKELRQKFLRGKGIPSLSKADEIHVVCGLLKDFLRKLWEPLVTFRLHAAFLEAADLPLNAGGVTVMCQLVDELPQPNRDTLAFLMLHLQRVMKSPDCKMNIINLARVFGPTLVGHAISDPTPMTIMQDTSRQPKVVARLLSLPAKYWSEILEQKAVQAPQVGVPATLGDREHLFRPLISPVINTTPSTPPSGCLPNRFRSNLCSSTITSPVECGKKPEQMKRGGKFFTSPTLK
nr:PREDICTED: rac GTPase-activating protein 1-like [Latimeria chalumnae]|eukprot:XP_014343778.1 PREDICTED: rac GTPase-activating protein 1-like [Latimeria chalumnae]